MSEQDIERFLSEQNKRVEDLYQPVLLNHWMVATTGEQEWSDKHEQSLSEYWAHFSDRESFQKVTRFRKIDSLPLMQRRQLDDLHDKMIKNQFEEGTRQQILSLEKKISHVFTTFQPQVNGSRVSNNELLDILRYDLDHERRKQAWFASKEVGKRIEKDLLQLIRKRNEVARNLGFETFYHMSFATQELDLEQTFAMFETIKKSSDQAFRMIKDEIDEERAKVLKIKKDDLRPWDYVDPFFQEAPSIEHVDFDSFYKDQDLEQVVSQTFQAMELPIDDILKRSDLYPRKNKNPFGFCTDMDRRGDIRVLLNLDQSMYWVTALLHEFGHAVYFKFIDSRLPFLLRFHSHTLTTEASALFFGRMTKMAEWYERFLGIDRETCERIGRNMEKMLQRQMVVSTRWMLTFSFFEKSLYEDPDQDINALWWKLVKEIQYMAPPEDTGSPDWAAKMHFSLAPVYYQDYLLGEMAASQLHHYIKTNVSTDLFSPNVGTYLKENVFKPGALLHWNDKMKKATGEYLTPTYFIKQFFTNDEAS
ncbi:peptidase M3A and M3B thimet/oligopeptidase F [Halalkalibacterium halodurans]|uniref:peptidase M3A and M3B thimet/oligopeptidase F n=1 Tax=Halalkalibacterium halodurans TaxID=86665 RepID=UPI002E1BDAE2|nr:peptidase M3A and M3B thimet/oligopeptidase F [Halalkalibacterium halodurans]MED4172834.1 peptidase M3A and M3B thimet/oligopeptidase F [Halalkalibacterium halodurans]